MGKKWLTSTVRVALFHRNRWLLPTGTCGSLSPEQVALNDRNGGSFSLEAWLSFSGTVALWDRNIQQRHKIPQEQAWQWANTRKGYWRIARSLILHCALPDKYLTSLGFMNFVERYEKLHSSY
jgi:5-methylcytosine-specific restriction endonuclease McrA